MKLTIGKIISVYFVVMVLFFSLIGFLVTKCTAEVEEKGLKNIVNEVWEGKPEQ